MKKTLLVVLLVFHAALAFPQPRLAILPFAGGVGGQGEAVAALLSQRAEILSAFTLVPTTPEAVAMAAEHRLQSGAFADSDLAAGLGRMLGADYVLSGDLRSLGSRNLVVATLVRVDTLELAAGYHRVYRMPWEIRGILPSMARSLSARRESSIKDLPTLAVAPLGVSPGDDQAHDMETLAQILAIEIANSGEYAVLPRASAMRSALAAWEARIADERAAALDRLVAVILGILYDQDDGLETAEASATEIGRAAGADKVLSMETRALDGVTVFAAQILGTDTAEPVAGIDRGFRGIGEGVSLMAEVAAILLDPEGAPLRIAGLERERRRAAMFGDPARFWSLGISAGTAFATPLAIGTLHATLAPLPFSFLRLGVSLGFLSDLEMGGQRAGHFSAHPFAQAAFFYPFAWGGVFLGAGGGLTVARYEFGYLRDGAVTPTADFTAGVNLGNLFEVSYTLRTDFSRVGGKVSAGFTHRFRNRSR